MINISDFNRKPDRYPGEKQYPYSTTDVARMLENKQVNGNIKLRRFLRNQGVFEGDTPAWDYMMAGYFNVVKRPVAYVYEVPVIKVSESGVAFIRNLVKEKLESASSQAGTNLNLKNTKSDE